MQSKLRLHVLALLLGTPLGPATAVPAARAAGLALPVATPAQGVPAPYYRGDVLELQLTPAAARAVLPRGAGPTRAQRTGRLGVAAVDAVAASLGGTAAFEAEFQGETPPAPGDGPDLTAFQLLHLPPGADLAATLDRLRALPEVVSADPIAVLPVSSLPNDSLAFASYWLENVNHPGADIHAPQAWQVTPGDTSIVVGVIDTGVVPYHPDLGGRAGERGNLWINWAEKGGIPGVDDDGNGFVDDVAGWDFVQAATTPAFPGEDAHDEDNDPNDYGGHGTAVAGVIGAIAGNGIGLAGVVPQVRMMVLRIGWQDEFGVPPTGVVDMSYAAKAIRYATRNGCAVVNCSWQSANLGGLDSAVTAATRAGMVVVNAAGNGGTTFTYLGQRDDVIAVAATDSLDVVWPNSVTGPWVDLSAPGVGMVSTLLRHDSTSDSLLSRTPTYRGFLNGTSFAAPQVAGAVALLQARQKQLGLSPLTPAGALLRLRETTDNIDALQQPGVTGYGTGRLNLFRALTDPPRSLAVRSHARTIGPPVILHYNTGACRVIYAMSDRSLLAFDGLTGDTVWTRALPALPVGNLAAANVPPVYGPVIAVATNNGQVFLVRDDGSNMPGWPVTAQAGMNMSASTAIAFLAGGLPAVIAGGTAITGSKLWAFRFDGTVLPGFPFDPGVAGMSAVALGSIDPIVPGLGIAFTDGTGALHLVDNAGNEHGSFPTPGATNARAPVFTQPVAGLPPAPDVIVAASGQLAAYTTAGAQRWTAPLSGTPTQDPVLADLDGDGKAEIIVTTAGPNTIAVFNGDGTPFTGRPGWPVTISAPAVGPLIVGPLAAGHGQCVGFFQSAGFAAWDESAQPIAAFPKPGGAGQSPSLDELDGDGDTEIAAGSSPADSNVYTYDAGPLTWTPAPQWPTPRGDMGRTASHALGVPPRLLIDRIRPAAVTDLEAHALSDTSVQVSFHVTGDDSLTGEAADVLLRRATVPLNEANFDQGIFVPTPPIGPPGTQVTLDLDGLPEGSTWWFAVKVVDRAGNRSAVSNADSAALPGLAPGAITDLRVLCVSESTVVLAWTATGGDGAVGRPQHYLTSGSTAPLDAGNVDAAPLQVQSGAHRDAGLPETLSVHPLTPGKRWRFAVRGVDQTQSAGAISNVVEAVTPVGGALTGHTGMAVAPRPQPATGPVIVDWQGDPSGTVASYLVVYDITGRERRRIALGPDPGGSYNWDGRDGESRLLPAGLYFLRLVSGARHAGSRVVFVR